MTWRTSTLGECCEIVSGATPSTSEARYWDGDIEWATPKDLSELEGKYIERTARRITSEGLCSCAASILPPQSVLFSSRAPIGHVAINTVPMATNQGFKSFLPQPGVLDPNYLYHWLRAKRQMFEGLGNGATFKEVSKAVVSRVQIALPPASEQRRIADILDKADAIRRKRKQAIALTEDLLRSAFLDMFGDPVTNPKGWPVKPLGQVADAASGVAKGKRYGGQDLVTLPYMRVANVQDGHLDLEEVKTITVSEEDAARYLLQSGDVLLTEGGDPDKLGRGAVWRGEVARCIHQNHIFRVRPGPEVDSDYLAAIVSSERGKRYFLKAAKQTTGIATINMGQLKAFPTLVPPREVQNRYVTFAARANVARDALREHEKKVGELFGSLVSRAFSGPLHNAR